MYSLHKIAVTILLFFLSASLRGSDPYRFTGGAGQSGMGSVCIMKPGFWSSFHNQALLGLNNSFSAGINYNNRFNISEMSTKTAGMIIPAGRSSLGIIYSDFGYRHFRRMTAGISCGLALSETMTAGIQIDYFSEKTSLEYGKRDIITCEAGLLLTPQENLSIGIHIFNPLPNNFRKSFLPAAISIGTGVRLNRLLFAGAEAEISTGKSLIVKTGIQWEIYEHLMLRCGFCTENTSFSFGTGYTLNKLQLDIGFASHEKLGITSSVSIIFIIKP